MAEVEFDQSARRYWRNLEGEMWAQVVDLAKRRLSDDGRTRIMPYDIEACVADAVDRVLGDRCLARSPITTAT